MSDDLDEFGPLDPIDIIPIPGMLVASSDVRAEPVIESRAVVVTIGGHRCALRPDIAQVLRERLYAAIIEVEDAYRDGTPVKPGPIQTPEQEIAAQNAEWEDRAWTDRGRR